jgi:hypothetical protein
MTTKLGFTGNCRTTAMGIMPHKDTQKALGLSLSLDVPFWPQLPHISYFEDMYVQASEYFPGIKVDLENQRISLDSARFESDLTQYSERLLDQSNYSLSAQYSAVYHRFLAEDLSNYPAIRGQVIGPVSFGFKVFDEHDLPIIYDDSIRSLLFDFLSRKINAQYAEMQAHNKNAFVWLDEPGLGWIFSGYSGYNDVLAKREYADFLQTLNGPRALHLCANVNLPFLLTMGTDLLSFDAYQLELLPKGYAQSIADFLQSGGMISWGIVPTDSASLSKEDPASLTRRLLEYWGIIAANTHVSLKQVAQQALIAPARCCLKNCGAVGAVNESAKPGPTCALQPEETLVETAFAYLKEVSGRLREECGIQ